LDNLQFEISNGNTYQFSFHQNRHKMNGMYSLSTSTKANKFCQVMHQEADCVCSSCYAYTLESMRDNVRKRYILNGKTLSDRLLKDSEIAIIDFDFVRFNAFGELLNLTHYFNLMAMVEANPDTTFALWTKRPVLIKDHMVKWDNLFYIYSSLMKNEEAELPKSFDKVFTVFNKPYAREHNISINCTQSCRTCLLCYTKNDVTHIRELIR